TKFQQFQSTLSDFNGTSMSLAIISSYHAFGQKDRNVIYKVGVGELIYTPPHEGNSGTAVKVLKDVAEVLLNGQTTKQQPQYAEAVRASIVNGLRKLFFSDCPMV
ncbi:hypothetical protein, partial [Parabacteroides distasonis]|uniref:hypothetical protein n=1 Tax=Parabacteroides distasonis TaxID=823 RepID=UPI003D7F51EB